MAAQGRDLAVDRRGHVDPGGRGAGPEQVEAAHPVRSEPGSHEVGERHRVPRRRVDRIDGGDARRPVVGVVDAAAAIEQDLRVVGQDRVRPELADLADEQLPEGQLVGKRPVRLVEEPDVVIADDLARPALLGLTRRRQHERIDLGVLSTLVPARAADEPTDGSAVDPARGRGGRAEIGVVGVGDDQHESPGSPVVTRDDHPGGWRIRRHRDPPATTDEARRPGGALARPCRVRSIRRRLSGPDARRACGVSVPPGLSRPGGPRARRPRGPRA